MERFKLASDILVDREAEARRIGYIEVPSHASHLGLGQSYAKMGMWSQAQQHLETAFEIAKGFDTMVEKLLTSFWIERLLVNQYYADKQLIHVSEEKRKELLQKALYYAGNTLSTSMPDEEDSSDYQLKDALVNADLYGTSVSHIYLCHAQLYFLLGNLHGANQLLKAYFEEMLKDTKQRCQGCLQQKNEAVCKPATNLLKFCQDCEVAHYCSKGHFKLDWKRGCLVGHKKLCLFLERWRLVTKMEMKKKPKCVDDDSYEKIFSEFFIHSIFVPKIRDGHPIHETSK